MTNGKITDIVSIKNTLSQDRLSPGTLRAINSAIEQIQNVQTSIDDKKELEEKLKTLSSKLSTFLDTTTSFPFRICSAFYYGIGPFCKSLIEKGLSQANYSEFHSMEKKAYDLIINYDLQKSKQAEEATIKPILANLCNIADHVSSLSTKDASLALEKENIFKFSDLVENSIKKFKEGENFSKEKSYLLTNSAGFQSLENAVFAICSKLDFEGKQTFVNDFKDFIIQDSTLSDKEKKALLHRVRERELASLICSIPEQGSRQKSRELDLVSILLTEKTYSQIPSQVQKKVEGKLEVLIRQVEDRKLLEESWKSGKSLFGNLKEVRFGNSIRKALTLPEGARGEIKHVFSRVIKKESPAPVSAVVFCCLYKPGEEKLLDTKVEWVGNFPWWTYTLEKTPEQYSVSLIRSPHLRLK